MHDERVLKFYAVGFQPHDDVIKWKRFPRYWSFVRGIHRSSVKSPHKGQWRGTLKFSLICVWINGWVNNREAGDLRHYPTHDDVTVMLLDHLSIDMFLKIKVYFFVFQNKFNTTRLNWWIFSESSFHPVVRKVSSVLRLIALPHIEKMPLRVHKICNDCHLWILTRSANLPYIKFYCNQVKTRLSDDFFF